MSKFVCLGLSPKDHQNRGEDTTISKKSWGRTPLRQNNQSQYHTFHNLIKLNNMKWQKLIAIFLGLVYLPIIAHNHERQYFHKFAKVFRIKWPVKIFLMCLRSAQVCSESLLEHFIFQIFLGRPQIPRRSFRRHAYGVYAAHFATWPPSPWEQILDPPLPL